jgi:hypothetical protein
MLKLTKFALEKIPYTVCSVPSHHLNGFCQKLAIRWFSPLSLSVSLRMSTFSALSPLLSALKGPVISTRSAVLSCLKQRAFSYDLQGWLIFCITSLRLGLPDIIYGFVLRREFGVVWACSVQAWTHFRRCQNRESDESVAVVLTECVLKILFPQSNIACLV